MKSPVVFLINLLAISVIGCQTSGSFSSNTQSNAQPGQAKSTANSFEDFLQTEIPPSDGFDFPFGDADGKGGYTDKATGKTHSGWYVATKFGEKYSLGNHPAEDWNGNGCGSADLGQPVYAVAGVVCPRSLPSDSRRRNSGDILTK